MNRSQGLSPRVEAAIAAFILAVMAAMLVYQARRLAMTVDEPGHLLSAYLYWHGRDRLPPQDMPPLVKLAAGWAQRPYTLPLPADLGHRGDSRFEWDTAISMVARMPHALIGEVLFRSRLPVLVFPLMTALLLWRWGRGIFSPATGLVLAALFALEPTALGHGALLKNDHAATFTYFAYWFCAWKWWSRPPMVFAAIVGIAAGIAILSKLSMLILIPCSVVLVLIRWLAAHRPVIVLSGSVSVVLLLPYLLILAAYGFEVHYLADRELELLAATNISPTVAKAARFFQVVPVADGMWTGILNLFQYSTGPKPVYMLGEVHPGGHPLYFALAVAVKAQESILILFTAGLILLCLAAWNRRLPAIAMLWLAPAILYAGFASLSNLQLGLRLILPVLPFTILVCGVAVERMLERRYRLPLAACLALLAFQSLRVFPHGISYFNSFAGGPENGLRYLSDSNLDWGQALAALPAALDELQIERVKIFYFGGDTPFRLLKHNRFEFMAPPWSPELAKGERFEPEPGHYAISSTLLPGHLVDSKYRDYFEVFRRMTPLARVGNAIYVYVIPAVSTRR